MDEREFRERLRAEISWDGEDFDSLAATEAVLWVESLGVSLSEEAVVDIRDISDLYFYYRQSL